MQNILRDMKKTDMLRYLLFAPLCIMASTFLPCLCSPSLTLGCPGICPLLSAPLSGRLRWSLRLCWPLIWKMCRGEDQNGMYQTAALSIFQQLLPAACSAVSENRQRRAALEAHRGRGSCSRLTQRRCVRLLRRRGPPFCCRLGGQTALCWITYPFAYREDAQILIDISLALEWGRKYALVGPSGSGWPGAWRCGPAL